MTNFEELYCLIDGGVLDSIKESQLQRLLKINEEVKEKKTMEDFDKLLARIKAYRRHKDDKMVDEHAKSLGWVCENEESKEQKVSLEDIFKGIVETLEKEEVVVSETPVDIFNRIWASLQEQELDDSNKDKKEEVKEEPKAYILVDDKTKIYHVIMDKELLPIILQAYQGAFPDIKFKWEEIDASYTYGRNPFSLIKMTSIKG